VPALRQAAHEGLQQIIEEPRTINARCADPSGLFSTRRREVMAKSRARRPAATTAVPTEEVVTAANPAIVEIERKSQPVTDEAIRMLAYYKWERAGRPEGEDWRFWLAAEAELKGV
jgi:hypothetical protein